MKQLSGEGGGGGGGAVLWQDGLIHRKKTGVTDGLLLQLPASPAAH